MSITIINGKDKKEEPLPVLPLEMWESVLFYVPTNQINPLRQINQVFNVLIKGILEKHLRKALIEERTTDFDDFIKAGVDIFARDKQGTMPIDLVCPSDKQILLRKWASFYQVNPLHLATEVSDIELARKLIEEVAKPETLKPIH